VPFEPDVPEITTSEAMKFATGIEKSKTKSTAVWFVYVVVVVGVVIDSIEGPPMWVMVIEPLPELAP
jgi:hypothetical protein